ncbi:hypothetical protein [Streptomyces sp. NPDC002851]
MTTPISDETAALPLPGPPLGHVQLYAPSDWFDLLADPGDEEAVQARFRELTRLAYPNQGQDVHESIVEGVMNTRRIFLADGMLSCGLVAVPQTEDGDVLWQICSGVVEVGPLEADLDIGSVLTRFLGQQLTGKDVYLESFPTAIGAGVGMISTPQVFEDGTVNLFPQPVAADAGGPPPQATLGLAVALALPPGGGRSLLVIGHCLNANQVRELAAVVALMAGKSTIEVYAQEEAKAGA